MPESPRWHNGRLWFSNWGADEIVAVDLEGNSEVVGRGPEGAGWAVNWLPDDRMLITGSELVRVEHDGSRVRHADLSHLSPYGWSEMTVDGRGNVYVNTINFDFADFDTVLTSGQAPGKIALVKPDGEVREVASEIAFPNGMVITPDNKTLIVAESFAARLTAFDIAEDGTLSNRRVWADGVGPDGICLDTDGCIWASSGNMTNDCARIREGGEVLETIELDRPCFAAMLGGPDRRTLFMLTAEWRGTEGVEDVITARTGQVLVADAPAPGAAGRSLSGSVAFDAAGLDEESGVLVPPGDLTAVGSAELGVHRLSPKRAGDRGRLRAAVDLGAHGVGWHRRERILQLAQQPAGRLGIRVVASCRVAHQRVGAFAPPPTSTHLDGQLCGAALRGTVVRPRLNAHVSSTSDGAATGHEHDRRGGHGKQYGRLHATETSGCATGFPPRADARQGPPA